MFFLLYFTKLQQVFFMGKNFFSVFCFVAYKKTRGGISEDSAACFGDCLYNNKVCPY